MSIISSCPCCSGLDYQQCCEPFHSGKKIPVTAEALMRSRYSAYALQNAAYLMATWDRLKRPAAIDFSGENIVWVRLEITDTKKGGVKDNKGKVAFKAYYVQDGQEQVMVEISRFSKNNGLWFYLDGLVK